MPEQSARRPRRVSIREHRIPTRNAGPYIAAPGPDGALWFCENGAAKIGPGDTIWLKGGTTMTSARGGRIHIGYWSGKSFYNAGTAASPKQIRNGVDASPAWGSGPVTIDCTGMTIDTNPGYGCLNLIQDTTQVNFTNILGSSDARRISVNASSQLLHAAPSAPSTGPRSTS